MLTVPDHLPVIHANRDGLQREILHYLSGVEVMLTGKQFLGSAFEDHGLQTFAFLQSSATSPDSP